MRALLSLSLLLVVVACSKTAEPTTTTTTAEAPKAEEHEGHHKGQKIDREAVDADGVVRRGAKLNPETPALTVAELAQKASELDGKPIKLTGQVDSVCQPMGCWMVLKGDGQTVRISSKNHDIFVPKSSAGRIATVEGDLTLKTVPKEQAQHYEDERALKDGETRKVFTEDSKELSIAITALELKPAA